MDLYKITTDECGYLYFWDVQGDEPMLIASLPINSYEHQESGYRFDQAMRIFADRVIERERTL